MTPIDPDNTKYVQRPQTKCVADGAERTHISVVEGRTSHSWYRKTVDRAMTSPVITRERCD